MPVEIAHILPEDLRPLREEFVALTRDAFAGPPYYETETGVRGIVATMERLSVEDGFRCIGARTDGGPLVGFAYGFSGREGLWWREVVSADMSEAQTARWLSDYFEVTELAVLTPWRGQGIGGRLHDALIAGLPHRTAMLSTFQGETPALHLYRARGWQTVLDEFYFPGIGTPYRIMGLDLRPE